MHDQKKTDSKPLTDEQREQLKATEAAKGVLYTSQKKRYEEQCYSAEALAENAELIVKVPDAYSFYNYRREILLALWRRGDKSTTEASSPRSPREDLVAELKLNSTIIEKNYKIYAAFVHRHWVYDELVRRAAQEVREAEERQTTDKTGVVGAKETPSASTPTEEAFQHEFPFVTTLVGALTKERNQCERLLQLDERNFHVWNHRRWSQAKLHEAEILQQRALSIQSGSSVGALPAVAHTAATYECLFTAREAAEMAYTTAKIRSNFSNYSAWHQRALTIRQALLRPRSLTERTDAHRQGGGDAIAVGLRGVPYDVKEETWCEAVRSLLQEDLYYLTQAVYCDPNDQSAWFYASFMFSLFHAAHQAFPDTFPRGLNTASIEADMSADGRYAGSDIEGAFLVGVFNLLAEEERLGDHDCYLPHYFVFSHLADVLRHSGATDAHAQAQAQATVGEYLRLAKERGLVENNEDDGAKLELDRGASLVAPLGEALYKHLVAADPQRIGLYSDLLTAFA